MAAAPEADVSGGPAQPAAPPRAIARRRVFSELAVPRRSPRQDCGGGRVEASRAREGFAVRAAGYREPRPGSRQLSGTAPPRHDGRRREPRLHGDSLLGEDPGGGAAPRRLLRAKLLRRDRRGGWEAVGVCGGRGASGRAASARSAGDAGGPAAGQAPGPAARALSWRGGPQRGRWWRRLLLLLLRLLLLLPPLQIQGFWAFNP